MRKIIQCFVCGNNTRNPKYCSRSCSAQETNKTPKRKRTKPCVVCNTPILSKHKFCQQCRDKGFVVIKEKEYNQKQKPSIRIAKDDTIGDLIYDQFHRSATHNKIRLRAKYIIKKLGIKKCENCGYDKHIESAHINALSNFPLDTKVSVANSPSNLIGLCPNCHWEFDKGLLPDLISRIDRLNKAA